VPLEQGNAAARLVGAAPAGLDPLRIPQRLHPLPPAQQQRAGRPEADLEPVLREVALAGGGDLAERGILDRLPHKAGVTPRCVRSGHLLALDQQDRPLRAVGQVQSRRGAGKAGADDQDVAARSRHGLG
jgi:hypothetical protein